VSLIGFCGSRSLPASARPLVTGVVSSVLSSRRSLAVGCCVGADACVLRAVLAAGAAPRLCVFAAFGPVSPPCGTAPRVEAPGASRSLSWPSGVGAALRAALWCGGGRAALPPSPSPGASPPAPPPSSQRWPLLVPVLASWASSPPPVLRPLSLHPRPPGASPAGVPALGRGTLWRSPPA